MARYLIQADGALRELQAVCAWLEDTATSINAEPRRSYLPHTKLALKHACRTQRRTPHVEAAQSLDPDAVTRHGCRWAEEDDAHGAALARTLFGLLRAGDYDTALDLCRQSDESWRAASIAGYRFWEDDPGARR